MRIFKAAGAHSEGTKPGIVDLQVQWYGEGEEGRRVYAYISRLSFLLFMGLACLRG